MKVTTTVTAGWSSNQTEIDRRFGRNILTLPLALLLEFLNLALDEVALEHA
jgi:hypothetical protein